MKIMMRFWSQRRKPRRAEQPRALERRLLRLSIEQQPKNDACDEGALLPTSLWFFVIAAAGVLVGLAVR